MYRVNSNIETASRRARLGERHVYQVGLIQVRTIAGEHKHALQPLDRFDQLIRLPQRQPESSGYRHQLLRRRVFNLRLSQRKENRLRNLMKMCIRDRTIAV